MVLKKFYDVGSSIGCYPCICTTRILEGYSENPHFLIKYGL